MKTCFSLSILAILALAVAAHAQTVSPVPAPTIITSAPYTITAAGYYQLGANLTYSGNGSPNDAIITVAASNVTLDFAGHYIAGPTTNAGTRLYGVYASERANLLIQNGTAAYCYIGIYLTGDGSSTSNGINARVLNMTLTNCYGFGVYLAGVNNGEVSNCRVSNIGGSSVNSNSYGIDVNGSTGVRVNDNTVANVTATNGTAYGLRGSASAYYRNNGVTNCQIGVDGGKCVGTLTSGCTTPFNNTTTNVGLNN